MESYASDAKHLYIKVMDKIAYTVYLDLKQDIFQCNCLHSDHCIHQAAAFHHLMHHPFVAFTHEKISMELSIQEQAILYLEEIEKTNTLHPLHQAMKLYKNHSLKDKLNFLYFIMNDYYLYETSWHYMKEWYKENNFIHIHTHLILENEIYLFIFLLLYKYADFNVYYALFYDIYLNVHHDKRLWMKNYIERVTWMDESLFTI